MNIEQINKIIEELLKTNACGELKQVCNKYQYYMNTNKEEEIRKELIIELEEDIVPVDGLIAFCASEDAKKEFGEEMAKKFYDHGLELKSKGAKYCDCPACVKALELLNLLK